MTNCALKARQSPLNHPGGGGGSVCCRGCVVDLFEGCSDGAGSTAVLVWPQKLVTYWIPSHTCLGCCGKDDFLFFSCNWTWRS